MDCLWTSFVHKRIVSCQQAQDYLSMWLPLGSLLEFGGGGHVAPELDDSHRLLLGLRK